MEPLNKIDYQFEMASLITQISLFLPSELNSDNIYMPKIS